MIKLGEPERGVEETLLTVNEAYTFNTVPSLRKSIEVARRWND